MIYSKMQKPLKTDKSGSLKYHHKQSEKNLKIGQRVFATPVTKG